MSELEKWRAAALALPIEKEQSPLGIPQATFIGEVVDVVRELNAYWDAPDPLPKLKNNAGKIELSIGEECLSLRSAAIDADTQWLLLTGEVTPSGLVAEGREILKELGAGVAFLLDDDIQEPADQQLAQLKAAHANDGEGVDALVKALHDFFALAEPLRARLALLQDDFDVALIDRAKTLAEQLPNIKPSNTTTPESKVALGLRNRLLHLLYGKVQEIRNAAAFKFRKHPDILRKFTSAYGRKQRTEARKAKNPS
jgi:hypothetical protein